MKAIDGLLLIGCYALGVFTSYTFFKSRYEEKLEKDVESVKEYYIKKYEGDKDETDELIEEPTLKIKTKSSLDLDNGAKKQEEMTNYATKRSYDYYAGTEFPTDDEEESEEEPFEISSEKYHDDKTFAKSSFTWYAGDSKLVIEGEELDDEIVSDDDKYNYIGDVLEQSGFTTNQAKIIHIRNPKNKTDYEITKYNASYD